MTAVEGDLQNTVVLEPGFTTRDTTFARKPTAPDDSLSRWDLSTPSNRPGASSSKKRRLHDEFNRDENEDDAGNHAKPPPSGQAGARGQKFACPFRKHDPVAYCLADHTICAASSWPNTARLKYVASSLTVQKYDLVNDYLQSAFVSLSHANLLPKMQSIVQDQARFGQALNDCCGRCL